MELTHGDNNRVLIVDDQKEIHRDFEEILQADANSASTDELADAFGSEEDSPFLPEFELLHASSGEAACGMVVAGLESNRPLAVAYVDVRMPPGIDGIETVRRIRKVDRAVEIVLMTAYSDVPTPLPSRWTPTTTTRRAFVVSSSICPEIGEAP